MAQSGSTADLDWLLDDLVGRVKEIEHAIVLSGDGLLVASSKDLAGADAEHLAAGAAGLQSLATGISSRIDGGAVRQTVVEWKSGFLVTAVAGEGARLAVLCLQDSDIGLIAYELEMLVTRVGQYLTSPARRETLEGYEAR
ncbi:roadblock/LC7 domain-containing protein [Nonomuraea sp. B19D2]|uniref:roadblock/LC7 domain-containing protein n=1 Tax=Nonomuraea sp. B19D2 TaxID=3159561 RepID=UPI0032D9CAAF